MNIGKLYDQSIAGTYDQDQWGLLSGGRNTAFRQIQAHVAGQQVNEVLDLAAGTGESLLKIKELFPEAKMHGIDLSSEMLDIAKTKLSFNAVHDDVANTGKHFSQSNIDLMLMHFLTTFVDGNQVVQDTSKLLRSGGYYSIVSSTYEAFPKIYALARMLLSEDFIKKTSPSPIDTDTIASYFTNADLEVVAVDTFTKTVQFSDFNDFYDFGMNSGFFTHVLAVCDKEQIEEFARQNNVFPLEDQYRASVLLARKP
jgi:trans-aconitate methyltransferase